MCIWVDTKVLATKPYSFFFALPLPHHLSWHYSWILEQLQMRIINKKWICGEEIKKKKKEGSLSHFFLTPCLISIFAWRRLIFESTERKVGCIMDVTNGLGV